MSDRSDEAADLLRSNAIDFLNGGLSLLSSSNVTLRDAKIAVISIQTAVELFAKYRIVRESGFQSIIRKGGIPKGGNLSKAAAFRHFSTIGFDQCFKLISDLEGLSDWQRDLVHEHQKLRNTLVHFAGELEVEDAQRAVAGLLVQVLALFAAGTDRDLPEMQTHRQFLDRRNFEYLTSHPEFLIEAFDTASSDPDAEEILLCWECSCETLSRRPGGAYFCWTCGLTAEVNVAGFAPCWQCSRPQSVVYDRLNVTNGVHYGRCISCEVTAYVADCELCNKTWSADQPQGLGACDCESDDEKVLPPASEAN